MKLFRRFREGRPRRLGHVVFNMRPAKGPWGGSSAFVRQLSAYLQGRGYSTGFRLSEDTTVIVLIDPRPDLQNKAFGMEEIASFKARHPYVRILHRINECDQRKGTAFMDALLAEANHLADYTVFISRWLRDYHAARWFDQQRPHCVIYNGADPRVFHPAGAKVWRGQGPMRFVTHHWSANPLKGFDVYETLDREIAKGRLKDVELWVIGRWPENLRWQAARVLGPMHGHELASRLRDCHAYITASRWEPCGMHHVEGAQCGLPLAYHVDGGGIVEAGKKYGVGFEGAGLIDAIETLRTKYAEYRERVLAQMPCGDRMAVEYAAVIQMLAVSAGG